MKVKLMRINNNFEFRWKQLGNPSEQPLVSNLPHFLSTHNACQTQTPTTSEPQHTKNFSLPTIFHADNNILTIFLTVQKRPRKNYVLRKSIGPASVFSKTAAS